MHEYDSTLKRLLTRAGGSVLAELTGFTLQRWHNVDMPAVRSQRADLLGETADGTLVHIELQSTNDTRMELRMLEYAMAIQRQFGRFPAQLVLYVGNAPMRMKDEISEPKLSFAYQLADIRELDGAPLLASGSLEDNVIAVLTQLSNEQAAVRQILARIAAQQPEDRGTALQELMILAGLRNFGKLIEKEMENMPILDDIMDHDVLGPKLKRALAEGLERGRHQGIQEGRQEGLREGLQAGERLVILRLIQKRFGPLPEWASQRINNLPAADLEQLELRLLEASKLEDLLL